MTTYFMDTSALIKHYISEEGSNRVKSLVKAETINLILIAELTTVEMCSAIARRQRLNQLSAVNGSQLRKDFLIDVDTKYFTVFLDKPVWIQATDLVSRYPLRALDAIQLSAAIAGQNALTEKLVFVSADNDLLGAAAGEGFRIDNPLLHPSP